MSELQQLVCGKNHTDNVLKGGFKDICEMAIALKVTGKKYFKDTLNLFIVLLCTHLPHCFPVSIHSLQCIHGFYNYVTRYLIGIKLCCSVQDN